MQSLALSHEWTQAVSYLARKAREHWPEDIKRVEKAEQMVLEGKVSLNQDGSFEVEGQGNYSYRVENDHCNCADAQFRAARCKHRIAVAIYRGAVRLTVQQHEAMWRMDHHA